MIIKMVIMNLSDYNKAVSEPQASPSNLGQKLLTAFNDPEFSDLILEVVGTTSEKPNKKNMISSKQFHCHKVILASQSKVFAEMLKEKVTRVRSS